jgi:hypothetical protein
VENRLQTVSRPVMTPWRFVAFRLFTLTIGRWPGVGRWLKKILVHVLIYRRQSLAVRHTRSIRFADDGVRIEDRFEGDGRALRSLERVDAFVTIHMGSARYFVPNELDGEPPSRPVARAVDLGQLGGGSVLERTIAVPAGGR